MTVFGVSVLASVALAAALYCARLYLHHRMSQAFGLGMRVGTIVGAKGQDMLDEQLRAAGIDPDKLPGRSS